MTERSELALPWVFRLHPFAPRGPDRPIVLSFFVLSVQPFVAIIGFMLTTLVGFVATCRWAWALGDDGDRGGRAVVAVVGIGRRATGGCIIVDHSPVRSPRIDP